MTRLKMNDGAILHKVGVPAAYRALVDSPADSMTPAIRLRGVQWDVRAAADRMVLRVSGDKCHLSGLKLGLRYAHTIETWQPLDTKLISLHPARSEELLTLFPAFYRPTQHFEGIIVPAELFKCKVVLERIKGASRLPIVMTAWLQNGKLIGPSRKKLGGFSTRRDTASITRLTTHISRAALTPR